MAERQSKFTLKSKTFWFNLLATLAAVLGLLQGEEWIAEYPKVIAGLAAVSGLVNIALRFLTVQPIHVVGGKK